MPKRKAKVGFEENYKKLLDSSSNNTYDSDTLNKLLDLSENIETSIPIPKAGYDKIANDFIYQFYDRVLNGYYPSSILAMRIGAKLGTLDFKGYIEDNKVSKGKFLELCEGIYIIEIIKDKTFGISQMNMLGRGVFFEDEKTSYCLNIDYLLNCNEIEKQLLDKLFKENITPSDTLSISKELFKIGDELANKITTNGLGYDYSHLKKHYRYDCISLQNNISRLHIIYNSANWFKFWAANGHSLIYGNVGDSIENLKWGE